MQMNGLPSCDSLKKQLSVVLPLAWIQLSTVKYIDERWYFAPVFPFAAFFSRIFIIWAGEIFIIFIMPFAWHVMQNLRFFEYFSTMADSRSWLLCSFYCWIIFEDFFFLSYCYYIDNLLLLWWFTWTFLFPYTFLCLNSCF